MTQSDAKEMYESAFLAYEPRTTADSIVEAPPMDLLPLLYLSLFLLWFQFLTTFYAQKNATGCLLTIVGGPLAAVVYLVHGLQVVFGIVIVSVTVSVLVYLLVSFLIQKKRDYQSQLIEEYLGKSIAQDEPVRLIYDYDSDIACADGEELLCVLPGTMLAETRAVRTWRGVGGPSYRVSGITFRGESTGQSESHEELRPLDEGRLVVTSKRLLFIGKLRSVSARLRKIFSVDWELWRLATNKPRGKAKNRIF